MGKQEVLALARRLSKAQRDAILGRLGGYLDPNTVRSLRHRGIMHTCCASLTPLGLAVRNLISANKGEAK